MLKRFYIYQKERFPLLVNLLLITALTFSTMSFSRNLMNPTSGVDYGIFISILTITFTTFFLIRLIDEFKDFEIDKEHRPYLPLHRGLVSKTELKVLIGILAVVQAVVMIFFIPFLWPFYLIMMGYLFLMSFEFFISEKIEKLPIIYATSHMVIIMLVDLFASTGDWYINEGETHLGLYVLLGASFFNGLVVEFGRKIKAPENEEFNSYTKKFGVAKTVNIWFLMLFICFTLASICCFLAGYSPLSIILLAVLFVFGMAFGIMFKNKPTVKGSKMIEVVAGIWTLGMYLIVGCYAQIETFIGSLF